MKTLIISLGLTALAASASAYTRVVIASPAVVFGRTECRPVAVERVVRPVVYCAPVATFRGRTEVIVRGRQERYVEPVRHPEPVRHVEVVRPGHRR